VKATAGDIYNGKYYYNEDDGSGNDRNIIHIYDIDGNSFEADIVLDSDFLPADFVVKTASNGDLMAYGAVGVTATSHRLYKANLTTGNVDDSDNMSFGDPDGDNGTVDGTAFLSDNGAKLYIGNNGSGNIYRIDNIESDANAVLDLYSDKGVSGNDGASCRDSDASAVDTDGDSIADHFDLDSDNDGIPDNVEAQKTASYDAPDSTWDDGDGDGMADQYDPDNNGTAVPLPDIDGDGTLDFLDSDSDNDGYTDCEEGLPDTTANKSCPVASVEGNGRVSWAGSSDYSDINGIVDTPSSDLFNETGDTSEVGYREFLCGKALTTLTKRNWKLISIPCDTGSISIQDLLGNSLGQYGEPSTGGQWVMYRQSALVANDAGNDNFEINTTSKPNTNKTKLDGDDIVVQGVGYWIIWDDGANNEVNVTINESIDGINPTQTTDADNDGIDDPDFTKVYERGVPNNDLENGWAEFKKFMAGNPFPYAFEVKNLYFAHDVGTGSYYPMGDANNDTYINATFYKYDSSDRSSKSVTDGGGYEAVNPGTPGFTEGGIKAMEGFFIKINGIAGETKSNGFAYPLITKNGSGN
jgi:hypothetical protein